MQTCKGATKGKKPTSKVKESKTGKKQAGRASKASKMGRVEIRKVPENYGKGPFNDMVPDATALGMKQRA